MQCTTSSRWRRVSRREPCPVCDKPDWCLVGGPPGAVTAVICARVESPKAAGKAGWLHRLVDDGWHVQRSRTITFGAPAAPAKRIDLAALAARYFAAVKAEYLEQFAASVGLTVDSLRRLRVGWAADKASWSFPMTDATSNVLGIRLRAPNGRKWSVSGGHEVSARSVHPA